MQEKVILLHIGSDYPRWEEQFLTVPPLGILAVGSYLAAQNVPVELIDVQMDFGFGLTTAAERAIAERVARYLHRQADTIAWIGVSQLSNTTSGVMLAQQVHEALPETPIIFGGYFPSCSYQRLLQKYPFITAVVRGDGEAAALQISRSLADGQPFLCDQTPNLAWLSAGEIHTTPVKPVDLKTLPILDYGLLRNKSCYQLSSIMTSRGCPFHCIYCTEAGMRPYATYPIEWVERQLDNMEAAVQCSHAILVDPLFGLGRERMRELCQIMSKHRFKYAAESRVDVLSSPGLIPLLRQAGIEFFFLGIESTSPSTLLRMNKVHSEADAKKYIEDALMVARTCFENNIVPELGLMVGFPGDTEADLQASLEFVKKVEQIHEQVAAETDVETGFIPFSQTTQVYDGTPLAERLTKDFQVALGVETFDGERTIVSPSPELNIDTIRHYEAEINNHGCYTSKVQEVVSRYISFSGENFVATHPELTDDQGVTLLSEKVQRLSA